MMLFLSLIALLVVNLLPSATYGLKTIVVSSSGVNEKECIRGSEDCKTLDFVLQELSQVIAEIQDVTINVEYSHAVKSVNASFNQNIQVYGYGNPIIYCNNSGFLHFSSMKEFLVGISFEGITFTGCNGYPLPNEAWMTGFSFLNFDYVSLTIVSITDSSDVYLAGNKHVSISNCQFYNMTYHYGVIFIPFPVEKLLNITSTYAIMHSIFTENIGVNAQGIIAIDVDSQTVFFGLYVSECTFYHNWISSETVNKPHTSSQIYISIVELVYANLINVTVAKSNFIDISNSGLVWIYARNSIVEDFVTIFESNTLKSNNYTKNNELVLILLDNIEILSLARIQYTANYVINNEGIGFDLVFEHIKAKQPASVLINGNTFMKNYGEVVKLSCSNKVICINLVTVNASNNVINHNTVSVTKNGVMAIQRAATLILANLTFYGNSGTALYIRETFIQILGNINFTKNAGKFGGAFGLYGKSNISVGNGAIVSFTENAALYGAGMYVGFSLDICDALFNSNCEFIFHFNNNRASSSGDTIYFHNNELAFCITERLNKCFNTTSEYENFGFGSFVNKIEGVYGNANNGTMLKVFPGQNLIINSSVVDVFNLSTTCIATVFLQCDNQVISCESNGQFIQMQGLTSIILGSLTYTSNVKLLAPSNISNSTFNSPSLRFKCEETSQYVVYLDLTDCPLGFTYNQTTSSCQCAFEDHDGFLCSVSHGMACVANGYWLGAIKGTNKEETNTIAITQCQFQNCHENDNPCLNIVGNGASNYELLGTTEDDQCENNHGGIMCVNCREGATFSFEASQCIDNKDCKIWQPFVLLIMVIFFQFVLAFGIQIFLNFQGSYGIGFLFGVLFYIAVVNNLPFAYYEEYYYLKNVTSFFTSVFLLNMELFGRLNWCFFSSLTILENYAFHYLGPVIVAIVVLTTMIIAHKCPRLQYYFSVSPLQAICLLLLLSFWSISNTSLTILQFSLFPGVKVVRVAIQPELEYFTDKHIPFALLSITVCLVLVFPFLLILLLSQCISKKVSLHRIQPLLDQFQSCYKDRYRWYPGVYMLGWMIIVGTQNKPLTIQSTLAIMLSLLCVIQPYSSKWLNVSNSLLLIDLFLVNALLNEQSNPNYEYTQRQWIKTAYMFLIYILCLLPVLYIIMMSVLMVLMRFKITNRLKRIRLFSINHNKKETYSKGSVGDKKELLQSANHKRVSRQMIAITESGDDELREPFMVLLQEELDEKQSGYGTK